MGEIACNVLFDRVSEFLSLDLDQAFYTVLDNFVPEELDEQVVKQLFHLGLGNLLAQKQHVDKGFGDIIQMVFVQEHSERLFFQYHQNQRLQMRVVQYHVVQVE